MTKRSAFDLAAMTAGRIVPGDKLPPPKDLTAKERKVWVSIVDPLPSGFFTLEMTPLLRSLVKAIMYARSLEAVVDRLMPEAESWPAHDERWAQVDARMREVRAWHTEIVQLSRALRLSKQARYPAVKADAATRRTATTAPRPWENWRGGTAAGDRALEVE